MADILTAVEELLPVFQERVEKDGVAWVKSGEIGRSPSCAGMNAAEVGAVSKHIASKLGVDKLENVGSNATQALALRKIIQKHNGWTEEAKQDFYRAHPGVKLAGPVVAAVLKRFGLYTGPKGKASEKSLPKELPGLRDAMPLLNRYEALNQKRSALVDQIETLKEEVDKVDQELSVFRPLVGSLEALKNATSKIKKEMEVRALNDRGATSI